MIIDDKGNELDVISIFIILIRGNERVIFLMEIVRGFLVFVGVDEVEDCWFIFILYIGGYIYW